jgi:hypothetical protein
VFVSVDWISFTFSMELEQKSMAFELWGRVSQMLAAKHPLVDRLVVQGHEWTPRQGRAPYNAAMQRADNGVMVFANQRIDNALMEISGIGCDALGGIDNELLLLKEVQERLTRIDIAVDIYTEVRPDEFANQRNEGHFKAWSEAVSASGHTVYVGSKHSDRYARVYRYNAPHPRSAFLRVEHVLKAEQARAGASVIGSSGIHSLVAQLGNTFGWQHSVWTPEEDTAEALAAWRPERRQGKTVAWLYAQVLPAIAKLHRDGAIDVRELYHNDLLPMIDGRKEV